MVPEVQLRILKLLFEETLMTVRTLPLLLVCLSASAVSIAQTPAASPPASPTPAAGAPRSAHQGHDVKLHLCMAEADQQHLGTQARKNYVAECVRRP